jgi:2-polyprenyl-6-methoxyphenol hydroxylase-like FAD-dependent oxidoreductase
MRVLISGSGIAGLTQANCLNRHDIASMVIEQAGNLRQDGYAIASVVIGQGASLGMAGTYLLANLSHDESIQDHHSYLFLGVQGDCLFHTRIFSLNTYTLSKS